MPTFTAAETPVANAGERGFTLVELMVVMLIFGLAAGAVALGGSPADRIGGDAGRFAARAAAARDLAVTGNRPISVWVARSGYGFDRYENGRWQPLDERPLATARWPAGTEVATSGVAGRGAALGDGTARLTFDNLGMPDSPATVSIARDGRSARIAVRADGSVELER